MSKKQIIIQVLLKIIGALVIVSFWAWIITLAFPITFFQAYVISMGYRGILLTIEETKK